MIYLGIDLIKVKELHVENYKTQSKCTEANALRLEDYTVRAQGANFSEINITIFAITSKILPGLLIL